MTASHTPDEIPPSSEAAPLILDVKGNALDDGPGIRSVVFFKGCPLSCVWCHNPESKKALPELAFDAKACAGCEGCLAVCEAGARSRRIPGYVDRRVCQQCFACAAVCPLGALAQVGPVVPGAGEPRRRTVDTLFAYVKTYFQLGGMQMQTNVVTSAMLRGAMAHPENYRNLLVRISGYNAYFVTLNRNMPQALIERAQYGL